MTRLPPPINRKICDRLHIGCFDCPVDGWLNTDITPHIWISRVPLLPSLLYRAGKMPRERFLQHQQGVFRKVQYLNLFNLLPYADHTFQYVFSSHVFEHLPRTSLSRLLKELFRVLKPGGTMRVSVPDLTVMVEHYQPEAPDSFVRAVFEIDHVNTKNRHHWMYAEKSMREALLSAGFVNVTRCQYSQGKCPDLHLLDNRPEHSLFMEADKPETHAAGNIYPVSPS
jgi:predicted SAM-dependent methyltransferase